jgi:hypothetical protein
VASAGPWPGEVGPTGVVALLGDGLAGAGVLLAAGAAVSVVTAGPGVAVLAGAGVSVAVAAIGVSVALAWVAEGTVVRPAAAGL